MAVAIGGYLSLIVLIYSSQFNFFSSAYSLRRENITPTRENTIISLRDDPVIQLSFEGNANDLGLIAVKVNHPQQKPQLAYQSLVFSLKEIGRDHPIAVTTYTLDYFNDNSLFPFGFPKISHSQGKNYIATFSLSNKASSSFVTIDTSTFQAIYPANKKEILSHPQKLVEFLKAKIISIFTSQEAFLTFILGLPFIILSSFLFRKK